MPLIAPDVARFAINGDLNGEDCINIIDVALTGPGIESRENACSATAGDILNNWTDHILPLLSGVYTANSVSWIDLDSADGSTGTRTSTSDKSWPASGGQAVAPVANNTYARIAKVVDGKSRRQRNGTLRLGGIPEAYTSGGNGNVIEAGPRGNINAGFEAFKDGVNDGEIASESSTIVLVHTVDGVYSGRSDLSRYSCRTTVGTLRRRMPGYGS